MHLKNILNKIYSENIPTKSDLVYLLSLENESDLQQIFASADKVRQEFMGDSIFLRGLIEISNHCKNLCTYCGLNATNTKLERYRLTKYEILASVDAVHKDNIGTVVLQSGEEGDLDINWMADVVRTIHQKYPELAITLSLGEKTYDEYKILRAAGADRYLLKMETYNPDLYKKLHPKMSFETRLKCLDYLSELGFQVGSGNIVGLKYQTLDDLATDIINLKKHNYEMISISPFIPHPETELGTEKMAAVPLVLKVLALTRIVTKNAHMPATTALGSMGKDYRIDAFKSGANIVMPNYTPMTKRKLYEIYPNKRCISEAVGLCSKCLENMAISVGRNIGKGRGDSIK